MTNPARLFLLMLILALASACGGSQQTSPESGASESPAPDPEAVQQFIADAVGGADWTVREVRQRLGVPREVETEATENRHDPSQTDTLRTLVYDGLRVEFYHVSATGKEILQHITLTGERYEGPQGLQVGMSSNRIRQILGEPSRREDGELIYEVGSEPTPTGLTVHVENDAATRFEWSFYVD